MSDYNLGTASGRIEIDGRAAALGFKVAETAAGAFFDVVRMRVAEVQQLGRRMAAVGAAGVSGFGIAVKVASSFEKQMSGVKAVTGSVGDEFDALREKALQLGSDTTFSASEAALAIEELAKAGIPVEDILKGAADGAVALAAAGGVSLPEAATIAANAMNQFGLEAKKIPEVADILAGVANTSAADVSSIGQSLSQAGAVANVTGMTFRDTAIAIGELADAGINGSDAGTSLKTMLMNLIPATDQQKAKFKELGLLTYDLAAANKILTREGLNTVGSMEEAKSVLADYMEEMGKGSAGTVKNSKAVDDLLMKYGALNNKFFDAQGNLKNLGQVQEVLRTALAGMSKEVFKANGEMKSFEEIQKGIKDGTIDATAAQKLQTLETLFGADAMRAAAIMAKEGGAGYKEFATDVAKVSAADVAKDRLDNLSGAVEAFKGSMETAMITIGSVFIPVITKMVNAATAVVNAFNRLPGPIKTAIAVLGLIVSSGFLVIGMFLALLPLIASMIVNMVAMKAISGVIKGFKTFFLVLKAGNGTMAASRAAALTTGGAFQKLTARMLLASKAAILMGRGFLLLWTAITGPIGIVLAVVAALGVAGYLLYKKWAPFRNLVDQIAAVLKQKLIAAWNAMKPVIAAVVASLVQFGKFVASTLLPVLAEVGQMLMGKLGKGFKEIMDAVMSGLVPALQELASKFQGEILPALKSAWDAAQPLVTGFLKIAAVVGGFLISALMKLGAIFIKYIMPILIKIAGFLTGVFISAVVDLVKGLVQAVTGIVQIFSGLIDFFKGLFTGNWSQMWDGIVQIFKGIWNLIIGLIKTYFAVGIIKLVGLGFRLLMAIVRGGWNLILAIFRSAGMAILNIVKGAFRLILAGIRLYINMWKAIIRGAWNIIRAIFRGAVNAVKAVVQGAFRLISSIIRGQMNAARSIITGGWNAVKSATSSGWNRIKSAVTNGIKAVTELVKDLPGKLVEFLTNAASNFYDAGAKLMKMLADGIKDKIGDAIGALEGGVKKLKGLLPGSPVKWGPLKSWNNGGAGKRLVGMLQGGIESERDSVAMSAARMAGALSNSFNRNLALATPDITGTIAATPMVAPASPTARPSKAAPAKNAKMRLVEGTLSIDRSGRAFIRGIAEEVVDDNEEHNARGNRRNPK